MSARISITACIFSLLGLCAGAETVTVASWGGAYSRGQIEAFVQPYANETGVYSVMKDYNGGLAEIRAQIAAGNVQWDVMSVDASTAELGCEQGLFSEIPLDKLEPGTDGTPAAEDFLNGGILKCGIASAIYSTALAFDSGFYGSTKPQSVEDFFDIEAFPGKRGARKSPRGLLEWALIADGVPTSEVYRILSTNSGVDQAFEKLDTIKDSIVFWEGGAQPAHLLADGEVRMTSIYQTRAFAASEEGQVNLDMIWDGQIWSADYWVVVNGAPNKDAAINFVSFSTEPQTMAEFSKYLPYGPARKSSIPLVGSYGVGRINEFNPTTSEHFSNAIFEDHVFWADNLERLNERFFDWLEYR